MFQEMSSIYGPLAENAISMVAIAQTFNLKISMGGSGQDQEKKLDRPI